MAARLGREVHRRREVVAISADDQGVTATCLDGTRVSREGLHLLAAVLGAARRCTSSRACPARRTSRLKTLPYMINTIVFLVAEAPVLGSRRPVADHVHRRPLRHGVGATLRQAIRRRSPAWSRTRAASPAPGSTGCRPRKPRHRGRGDRAPAPGRQGRAAGGRRCIPGRATATPPATGPCSARARSAPSATLLANAAGRLHFCGEHTARANRGMEGAMESGERAAIEALQQL